MTEQEIKNKIKELAQKYHFDKDIIMEDDEESFELRDALVDMYNMHINRLRETPEDNLNTEDKEFLEIFKYVEKEWNKKLLKNAENHTLTNTLKRIKYAINNMKDELSEITAELNGLISTTEETNKD